jgi:hypothetical protein
MATNISGFTVLKCSEMVKNEILEEIRASSYMWMLKSIPYWSTYGRRKSISSWLDVN